MVSSATKMMDSNPIQLAPQPKIVWTIAGFDPSSGAGITADLTTFAAHGVFGCSAITALTVQTTVGVFGWQAVSADLLAATLERLDEDLPAEGIKVGMLGDADAVLAVARFLERKRAGGERRPVVVLDPVLRSSSGRELLPAAALASLHGALLPCVDWVTPNWAELAALSGQAIADAGEVEAAARSLQARYPQLTVVATGGDQETPSELMIVPGFEAVLVRGEHIATTSTHGTGCAFSSALLSGLVTGAAPEQAVRQAKLYVEGALRRAPGVGHGCGPMDLLWPLREREG